MSYFLSFAFPLRAAAVSVGLLALAACNSRTAEAPPAEQQAGQVIAKVGGEDVTIHELQNEYRHAGITPDKVNETVTRAILAELVRRKGLAQRAKAAGLDREPTVLLDVLRSREQVLATALLQRDIQAKVSSIGKAEIDRYINANPDRFSKRVRFDVDQLSIAGGNLRQTFLDSVKDAASIDAIEEKATEQNVPYSRGAGSLFSGDLPPQLLERLRARKDSDIFFIRAGNSGTFFKVRAEAPEPLEGDEAQRRAQVLMRNETAQTELTKKGSDTDVTYLGDYAKLMENASAAPPAGSAASTPAGGEAAPTTPAPAKQ
ncbi:MAG: hypothetical protein BGP06_12870 [Rhizobiales bacterium 65-9]|nr:hypothetical protein [Hyphomicrobiales bacterium]OJY37151.1 MAG: hypothetical protein BGP06_12870 [Rhizobiales bacterium 65-9]